jgi:hypothetical protein
MGRRPFSGDVRTARSHYLSELLIEVNFVLSLVPSPFTTVMIARAIPAAINPYSIAVAPDSSIQNFRMCVFIPQPNTTGFKIE